ncbi:protein I'm not dead yet 2 isoform X2 [Drosophila kikkawai]|uniref:Protein I'm not dead yet 2 isoform X2 n=1 Tax=Drosophila kikkawai TaxID=30033 RepID=A0ABM3C8M2_DROKI|nr:protein I'm not dead yet 2 isoform X2 [Drosophila kikkawai]
MADDTKIGGGQAMKRCCGFHWRGKATILIPLLLLPLLIFAYLNNNPAYKCMYLVIIMAFYWITEVIPLYVTAMLPVVFLPLFGILPSETVCRFYFSDTVVMFLGGLLIALAIEYSRLNQRIALVAILIVGCSPRRLHFGLVMVTCFISLWISNSATTAMMCPIVKAVLLEMETQNVFAIYKTQEEEPMEEGSVPHPSTIAMSFYLGIAYASSIGGCGTLIGTGTNLTFKGLYDSRFPNSVETLDFPIFMAYCMPFVVIALILLTYFSLQITHMGLFRPKSKVGAEIKKGAEGKEVVKNVIKESKAALGPMTCHEIQVAVVFILMVILLFTRKPGFVKGWADFLNAQKIMSGPPVFFAVILLFALPTQYTFFKYCCGKAPFPGQTLDACLSWVYCLKNTPFGLCFLLGGGFALAEGSQALAIKVHPLSLTFPASLACSLAFHLPVSTPPNAIIAGFSGLKTKYMAIAGILPTFWAFCCLLFTGTIWTKIIYPGTKEFPEWAK